LVQKAELYLASGQVVTEPSTIENNYNISETIVNPFAYNSSNCATEPVLTGNELLFGNRIVDSEENCLSTAVPTSVSDSTNHVQGFIQSLSRYFTQLNNWDNVVDSGAANVISKNLPSMADIRTAVESNPRLVQLAIQANYS